MKYGAMEGVLRQPREKVFEFASRIGLDGVELGLSRNYKDDTLWNTETRQEIKQNSADAGVEIPSLCLGLFNDIAYNPASPEPAESRTGIEIIRHSLDIAVDLGAKVILIPFFGSATIEVDDEDGVQRIIDSISKCVSYAKEAEVCLAIETKLDAFSLNRIIDTIGSEFIRIYYDVANAVWCGYDPAEEIRELGNRIAQVHAKDIEEGPGDRMLGEGRVDFDACGKALKAINYNGYVILETLVKTDAFADTKANLEYVKKKWD